MKEDKREYDYSVNPPMRVVVCVKCGKRKKYCAKNMCNICYAGIRNNKKTKGRNNLLF